MNEIGKKTTERKTKDAHDGGTSESTRNATKKKALKS